MNKITFPAAYGNETRTVEISSPSGNRGSFDITQSLPGHKGMFTIGQVVPSLGGWAVHSTAFYSFNKSPREIEKDNRFARVPFTQDDKDAILDRMVEAGMIDLAR